MIRKVIILLVFFSNAVLAESYFTNIDTTSVRVSPNGGFLAILKGTKDKQKLIIKNNANNRESLLVDISEFNDGEASLSDMTWLGENFIGVEYTEVKKGIENIISTKRVKNLLVLEIDKNGKRKSVTSVRTKGWLIEPLTKENGLFLYAKSGAYSKIYKIDARKLSEFGKKLGKLDRKDGGQFKKVNQVASVEGVAFRWFVKDGQPVSALTYQSSDYIRLVLANGEKSKLELHENPNILRQWHAGYAFSGDEESKPDLDAYISKIEMGKKRSKKKKKKRKKKSKKSKAEETKLADSTGKENQAVNESQEADALNAKELFKYKFAADRLVPIGIGQEDGEYYLMDYSEDKNQKIYLANFTDPQIKLVYDAGDKSVLDLVFNNQHELVGIKNLSNGQFGIDYLNVKDGTIESSYEAKAISVVVNESVDGQVRVEYKQDYKSPGTYFLSKNGKLAKVGQHYPKLKLNKQAVQEHSFVDNNGVKIPYLLNTPNSKGTFPLLVMPHGGPFGVHDDPYFDSITQFFNRKGFAVLRVNFRGSSGYGAEHYEGGKLGIHTAMLEDIHFVAKEIAKRKTIANGKHYVFGMSYGGYAAAMLIIDFPEFYRAAVTVAGVSDLPLMLLTTQNTKQQEQWLKEHVGDSVSDFEELAAASPVYKIDNLKNPLFIVHGKEDEIVDVEHSYRLKMAAELAGKNVEFYIEPEGKHSFQNAEELNRVFSKILTFLKKH